MSARNTPTYQLVAAGQKVGRTVTNIINVGAGVETQLQPLPYRLTPLYPLRLPSKPEKPSGAVSFSGPATAGFETSRTSYAALNGRSPPVSLSLQIPPSHVGGGSSGTCTSQMSLVPIGPAQNSLASSTAQKSTQTELTATQQQIQKRQQSQAAAAESSKHKCVVNAHTLIISLDQMLRAEMPSDPLRARLMAYAEARGFPLAQQVALGEPLSSAKQQQRLRSLLQPPSPQAQSSLPKQSNEQFPLSSSSSSKSEQQMFLPQAAVVSSQRSSLSSGTGACTQTSTAASHSNLCTARAECSRKQWEKRELLREHAALAAGERWLFERPLERADLPDEVRSRVADMRHLVTLTTRLEVEAAAEAATNKKANGKRHHRKKKHTTQTHNGNGGAQQSRATLLSSTSCFAWEIVHGQWFSESHFLLNFKAHEFR